MPLKKIGIALRSTVIAPDEIVKLAKVIDQSSVSHLFLPDLHGGLDSLEISSACLGVTKGLRVGSGVFQLLEQDQRQLVRRLETLQAISNNRYLMGIGTGDPGPNPGQKISNMLQRLSEIKKSFSKENGISFPETFIATLKAGIAKKVAGSCDGILLNFCSASYAAELAREVLSSYKGNLEIGCYLKTFHSNSDEIAMKLAVAEFTNYNMLGQYHKMFVRAGVSDLIQDTARAQSLDYPDLLREISPVNPDVEELSQFVSKFREAGVTIPCVYPYFAPGETFEFKMETIRKIISSTE